MTNPRPASTDQEAGRPAPAEARPMPTRRRRVALAVAVTAFLLWIGYLAFLAYTASHPIVLSRPQILVSNLVVIAELTGGADHPKKTATIVEVLWAGDPAAQPKVKSKITVTNLDQVQAPDASHPNRSWHGPGQYILPVMSAGKDTYRVTPIPLSPGFAAAEADRLRIYPATPSTRAQLDEVLREFRLK